MTREQRAAKNEAVFREVNERIKELALSQLTDHSEVLCECSDPNCTERLEITVGEYEAVRANGACFVAVAGHEDPAIESLVDRTDRFVVVEKADAAADVARDLDPRS